MSTFIPKFRPKTPKKFSEENWLDTEEPQVILYQGMRGSGKGVAVETTAEQLYNEGFSIWHLWGARSFENVYWTVNKDCKKRYDKMRKLLECFEAKGIPLKAWAKMNGLSDQEFEEYKNYLLYGNLIKESDVDGFSITKDGIEHYNSKKSHCKCNKVFPILWIVPDYIEFDEESLDRFNGFFWKDFDEYRKHIFEITTKEKELLQQGKLKKPEYLRPKPLIKIAQITTPTNIHRKEIFKEQFTQIVLTARDERRIVVMNPAIFEGQLDKFDTLSEIFRLIPFLMNKSGHFKPLSESDVGKARKYWTRQQKSWHKVAIVINELRSVAPSSKMHGEKSASSSKKAIFDYIPEARHYKTWFLGDYQNPQDLYGGVRHQANLVIIKRASENILGQDWGWLFDELLKWQISVASKLLKKEIKSKQQLEFYKSKLPKLKLFLDSRKPLIGDLPDNQCYVTWINNEYKRTTIPMPSFHHKQSTDDFIADTGIRWSVNMKKKPEEKKDLTKPEQKKSVQQRKKVKEEILRKIDYMRATEQKSWDAIKEELVLQENEGIIPNMGFESKTSVYFSNWYGIWKKKLA